MSEPFDAEFFEKLPERFHEEYLAAHPRPAPEAAPVVTTPAVGGAEAAVVAAEAALAAAEANAAAPSPNA